MPHLAGAGVHVEPAAGRWRVLCRGRLLGYVARPADAREPGGLPPRRAWRGFAETPLRWPALTPRRLGEWSLQVFDVTTEERQLGRLAPGWYGLELGDLLLGATVQLEDLNVWVHRRKGRRRVQGHEVQIHVARIYMTPDGELKRRWSVESRDRWPGPTFGRCGCEYLRATLPTGTPIRLAFFVDPQQVRGHQPRITAEIAVRVKYHRVDSEPPRLWVG